MKYERKCKTCSAINTLNKMSSLTVSLHFTENQINRYLCAVYIETKMYILYSVHCSLFCIIVIYNNVAGARSLRIVILNVCSNGRTIQLVV